MSEKSSLIKKWILIILGIIVLAVLVTIGNYWYFQKQISQIKMKWEKMERGKVEIPPIFGRKEGIEQEIAKEIENCQANFDLNKLDFKAPIWDTELSVELPLLIVTQAFEKNNKKECDYFKNKNKINPNFTVKNCQRRYFFLKLIDELRKGMNCQDFVKECLDRNILQLEVEENEREEANKIVCESLCRSYQNKRPVILAPEKLCDAEPSPQADIVDYLDPQANQLKTCPSGIADETKFLIAVSKDDANGCLTINNPRTLQFCQFYFDRDLEKQQNKFKETYCRLLVGMVIIPPE